VAFRVALRVRAKTARRKAWERAVEDVPARPAADEVAWSDLRRVLDEEIDRLPEKYRRPFVLCYLEGQTNEEAAAQLGCPKGTILSRLARGRERLRSRLARRGLALSAAALSTGLAEGTASAAVPALLASCTVEAAIPFAAGTAGKMGKMVTLWSDTRSHQSVTVFEKNAGGHNKSEAHFARPPTALGGVLDRPADHDSYLSSSTQLLLSGDNGDVQFSPSATAAPWSHRRAG
jgi:hypothetical protein